MSIFDPKNIRSPINIPSMELPKHLQNPGASTTVVEQARVIPPAPRDIVMSGRTRGGSAVLNAGSRVTLVDIGDDSITPELFTVSMNVQERKWVNSVVGTRLTDSMTMQGIPTGEIVTNPPIIDTNLQSLYAIVTYGAFGVTNEVLIDFQGSFSVVASFVKVEAVFPLLSAAALAMGFTNPTDSIRAGAWIGKGGFENKARLSVRYTYSDTVFIGDSEGPGVPVGSVFTFPLPPKCTRFLFNRTIPSSLDTFGPPVPPNFNGENMITIWTGSPLGFVDGWYTWNRIPKGQSADWIDVGSQPASIYGLIYAPGVGPVVIPPGIYNVSILYELEL
jgi:hypothetical protein